MVVIASNNPKLVNRWSRALKKKYELYFVNQKSSLLRSIGNIKPRVLLVDVSLPRLRIVRDLPNIQKLSPATRILVLFESPTPKDGISVLKAGARGYANHNLPDFEALAHEAAAVNEIKRHKRFTVVIGNPPYARHSLNPNKDSDGRLTFIGRLVEEYKEGCPELRKPAQAKYLQDDYVKFTRFAEYAVVSSGVGVIGLITNHGFLDNPTFRGMRKHLLSRLAKAGVLDLHGNANKKERAPGGSEDKNVFDIKQGVAIMIGARLPTSSPCEVPHGDLWGSRESKYRRLSSSMGKELSTTPLNPRAPQFSLRPRDETNEAEYLALKSFRRMAPLHPASLLRTTPLRSRSARAK